MSYYTDIDPVGMGEENKCKHCLTPCGDKTYCSKECYNYDTK